MPKYIQTDAAFFYPKAMRNLFSSVYVKTGRSIFSGDKRLKIEHRINNVSNTGKHNVMIDTALPDKSTLE